MKLFEFFGRYDVEPKTSENKDPNYMSQEEEEHLLEEVFWHILEDDDLHKKYFMPIAKKLKDIYDSESKEDDLNDWKVWIPMVNQGCREYFEKFDVKGDPKDVFHKKFRKSLCEKLVDHYIDDIKNGAYNLGH